MSRAKVQASGKSASADFADLPVPERQQPHISGCAKIAGTSSKYDLIWIKCMEWCDKYWGCHQMPERSFFLFGYQFPVCARCTGIMVGYVLAIILPWFISPSWQFIFFAVPMAIDGLTQLAGWRTSNNPLRLLTGILGGYGMLSFLIWGVLWIVLHIFH